MLVGESKLLLFANELSFDGKFDSFESYYESLNCLMRIKNEARKHGFSVQCTKSILNSEITRDLNFQQSLQRLSKEQRLALTQWVTQSGPFWDECRCHTSDDYFEIANGDIVTDTCIGEAAYLQVKGTPSSLISLFQPHWGSDKISVTWQRDAGDMCIDVVNQTQFEPFVKSLNNLPQPIESWKQLEVMCEKRCVSLSFSQNTFASLKGVPFVQGASLRILELLLVLDKLKCCFNEAGERTEEGHEIYQEHFTGDKAWFSDSSVTEKRQFEDALTFKHPKENEETLFCTWHGKVKTPQIRIHHSWPITKDTPLYVMYVGPKITKR